MTDRASSLIRVRMSAHDAHHGGNLVDGARMLALFGDGIGNSAPPMGNPRALEYCKYPRPF